MPPLVKLRVQREGEARYNRLAGAEPIRILESRRTTHQEVRPPKEVFRNPHN